MKKSIQIMVCEYVRYATWVNDHFAYKVGEHGRGNDASAESLGHSAKPLDDDSKESSHEENQRGANCHQPKIVQTSLLATMLKLASSHALWKEKKRPYVPKFRSVLLVNTGQHLCKQQSWQSVVQNQTCYNLGARRCEQAMPGHDGTAS